MFVVLRYLLVCDSESISKFTCTLCLLRGQIFSRSLAFLRYTQLMKSSKLQLRLSDFQLGLKRNSVALKWDLFSVIIYCTSILFWKLQLMNILGVQGNVDQARKGKTSEEPFPQFLRVVSQPQSQRSSFCVCP